MPKVVISDASCLIILSKIGELDLLHLLYSQVYITPEMEREKIKSIIQKILQTNFRISQQVINALLSRHGEK